ncbi:hypothetical protein L6452_15644 [Arctium lappa]|uniref:Uncharacterized protein n=1 Tax=Arctium lappa TaxID=4217 RepID=A0ACB9CPA3_ARCLA|nr:hypothetical protein L6452_15644 [Arctium lappa]
MLERQGTKKMKKNMDSSSSGKGKGSGDKGKTLTLNKRPKHNVESKVNEKHDTNRDVSRLNIPQKSTVVKTSSGVKIILPSISIDSHKQTTVKDKSCSSPSKGKSSKSKKQVGISKSPGSAKGSKSPISPMSHVKAKSPKRKERTGVVDYSRKTRTLDRYDTCESPASNSEFSCSMTTRSHTSKKKESNVTRKAEGDSSIKKKLAKKAVVKSIKNKKNDPTPHAKCVKMAWRKQFHGKRVRISAVMKRIEDLEDANLQFKINFLKLFICTIAECNSCGYCNPGVLTYIMDETYISKIDWSKTGFRTCPLIRDDGIQKERSLDVFAERSGNPKICSKSKLQIDDSFNSYGKKKEFKAIEIPKTDLGFSPDKHLDSPKPISSTPPMKGFFVTLNPKTKAICDAQMAKKRESKLGDSLRSPYVKRTIAIDALETSSEKKICAWINVSIEPIRWAALLNHEERFRSKTSPRRIFMHSAILHTMMIQHLHNVGHPSYDSFVGLEPVRIAVKWCTQSNSHDCGVFLMRHMECYMGELPYRWKSHLDVEGPNQVKQLQMLRNKYTAKLLLSEINLRRSFVISDCEKFNALGVKKRARLLQYAEGNRETRLASI